MDKKLTSTGTALTQFHEQNVANTARRLHSSRASLDRHLDKNPGRYDDVNASLDYELTGRINNVAVHHDAHNEAVAGKRIFEENFIPLRKQHEEAFPILRDTCSRSQRIIDGDAVRAYTMTPEGGSRSREEAFGGGPSNMTVPQLSERPKRRYQEQRMHLNQISARQLNGRAKQEAIAAINANLAALNTLSSQTANDGRNAAAHPVDRSVRRNITDTEAPMRLVERTQGLLGGQRILKKMGYLDVDSSDNLEASEQLLGCAPTVVPAQSTSHHPNAWSSTFAGRNGSSNTINMGSYSVSRSSSDAAFAFAKEKGVSDNVKARILKSSHPSAGLGSSANFSSQTSYPSASTGSTSSSAGGNAFPALNTKSAGMPSSFSTSAPYGFLGPSSSLSSSRRQEKSRALSPDVMDDNDFDFSLPPLSTEFTSTNGRSSSFFNSGASPGFQPDVDSLSPSGPSMSHGTSLASSSQRTGSRQPSTRSSGSSSLLYPLSGNGSMGFSPLASPLSSLDTLQVPRRSTYSNTQFSSSRASSSRNRSQQSTTLSSSSDFPLFSDAHSELSVPRPRARSISYQSGSSYSSLTPAIGSSLSTNLLFEPSYASTSTYTRSRLPSSPWHSSTYGVLGNSSLLSSGSSRSRTSSMSYESSYDSFAEGSRAPSQRHVRHRALNGSRGEAFSYSYE